METTFACNAISRSLASTPMVSESGLRIDNSGQSRFSSGRAYPQFIHSYLITSQIIIFD